MSAEWKRPLVWVLKKVKFGILFDMSVVWKRNNGPDDKKKKQ